MKGIIDRRLCLGFSGKITTKVYRRAGSYFLFPFIISRSSFTIIAIIAIIKDSIS